MTFKATWETTDTQCVIPTHTIYKMIAMAFPEKKLISHEMLSGGCANINIKIHLNEENLPVILRVYLRDKTASHREKKIATLVSDHVPVPDIYYIGNIDEYCFLISEFMPGRTLRDLLLSDEPYNLSRIMHETGRLLTHIAKHEFPTSGFFDENLKVIESIDYHKYINSATQCVNDEIVKSQLPPKVISKIIHQLTIHSSLFPDDNEKNLVHADFDPANILVEKINGDWQIRAILDWEFAFSGSVRWDVANMLRYAHHLPQTFQDSFLSGLNNGGIALPEDWQISIHLLNLTSLLDCLKRSNSEKQPRRCADICELINHILIELDKSQVLS